jgi:hypothetical protein
LDDPWGYEAAGYALFDMYPERRGNLFSDEVYRLVKAKDATTSFENLPLPNGPNDKASSRILPPNYRFSTNDVIMITLQPHGSGDFFNAMSLPTNGVSIEARVLNSGPTYIDIAVSNGSFEAAFGPAPNNSLGPKGDNTMRLRADQFFSNIPYERMVTALSQLTAIPDRKDASTINPAGDDHVKDTHQRISMDEVLREVILSTHAYSDPFSIYYKDGDFCDLQYLVSWSEVCSIL